MAIHKIWPYPRDMIPRPEKFILYWELLEKSWEYLTKANLHNYTIDDFIENKPINQWVQVDIRNMFMEKLWYKRS